MGSSDSIIEFAGQDFWFKLTGDEGFYIKLIRIIDSLPEKYAAGGVLRWFPPRGYIRLRLS
ncbi:MAG: hypothetical protein LBU26_03490 [Synergistaceae bacterium]|nr:hypothetical protein [Synergistaceae bacterium]